MSIKSVKIQISKKRFSFSYPKDHSTQKNRFLCKKVCYVARGQTVIQTRKWIQGTPFHGFSNVSFNLSSRICPIIRTVLKINVYKTYEEGRILQPSLFCDWSVSTYFAEINIHHILVFPQDASYDFLKQRWLWRPEWFSWSVCRSYTTTCHRTDTPGWGWWKGPVWSSGTDIPLAYTPTCTKI